MTGLVIDISGLVETRGGVDTLFGDFGTEELTGKSILGRFDNGHTENSDFLMIVSSPESSFNDFDFWNSFSETIANDPLPLRRIPISSRNTLRLVEFIIL